MEPEIMDSTCETTLHAARPMIPLASARVDSARSRRSTGTSSAYWVSHPLHRRSRRVKEAGEVPDKPLSLLQWSAGSPPPAIQRKLPRRPGRLSLLPVPGSAGTAFPPGHSPFQQPGHRQQDVGRHCTDSQGQEHCAQEIQDAHGDHDHRSGSQEQVAVPLKTHCC